MYALLIAFAGLSLAGLLMLARAAHFAPEGYQDDQGFHALHPGDLTASTPTEAASFGLEELLLLDQQMASQPWR